jgi:hypothetical protein
VVALNGHERKGNGTGSSCKKGVGVEAKTNQGGEESLVKEREKRRMKEKERELIAWFWRIQEARRREKGG